MLFRSDRLCSRQRERKVAEGDLVGWAVQQTKREEDNKGTWLDRLCSRQSERKVAEGLGWIGCAADKEKGR